MTTSYIRARSGVPVLITPSATVRDDSISYRATGVLSRLLDNAEGFGMTAEDLARGMGREGRDAVRTALRELQEAGYIVRQANRKSDGTFRGQRMYVYDTPQQDSRNREPENPLAGNPSAENPPAGKAVLKSSRSKTKVTTSIKVKAAAVVRKREHAAACDWKSEKGPKFANPIVLHNGVESWYPLDLKDAEELTTDEPDADIRGAVPAVVARGQSPVAALVRREINRQRAKRAAEAARPKSRIRQGMDALDNLRERFNTGRRPTDAQEVVAVRRELVGRSNTLALAPPSKASEAQARREDELQYIKQMFEYGQITDAERDQQQADVMAKYPVEHQGW